MKEENERGRQFVNQEVQKISEEDEEWKGSWSR